MARIAADVPLDVAFTRRWLTELAAQVAGGCDELTRLDAAIGDADHGVNMLRGMRATMRLLDDDRPAESPSQILDLAATRLVGVVGGAAGPLYGSAFKAMAVTLDGSPRFSLPSLVDALEAGLAAIQRLGAAEPGDKTMVDAWWAGVEAMDALREAPARVAVSAGEQAATDGMLDTIPMRARKGRASYLGWRSEGHQDPGATSTRMVFSSLLDALG